MAHYYHKITSPWKRLDANSATVDTTVFFDDYAEMLRDIQWVGTEKIDGTNLNFHYDGNHVHALGHTERSEFNKEVAAWIEGRITESFESIFEQTFGEYEAILSGELLGPKVQGNLYGLSDYQFIAFDIFCKTTNTYWSQDAVTEIAEKLGFARAPFVKTGTLSELKEFVMSTPASLLEPRREMEGLVIRPPAELKKANGERVIYKVKVHDLLGRGAGKII